MRQQHLFEVLSNAIQARKNCAKKMDKVNPQNGVDAMNTLSGEWKRPYRVAVFSMRYRPVKQLKWMTTIERVGVGWDLWTPVQAYSEARLPSAGSFLFPGIHAVRRAAMEAFKDSSVHQVQVRTNQDRKVYLWNRQADGRITGYRPE